MVVLLRVLMGCACDCAPDGFELELPPDVAVGDELVLTVWPTSNAGDWADEDAPGTVLRVTLGATRRDVVLPGGVSSTQSVALGAWDGGALSWYVEGAGDTNVFGVTEIRVDPTAAGTPVLGSYDASWWNDTPLVTYEEDGTWTWVFTDEDGGTGLLPTLLLASWGRPVDIEGLWDEASGLIQTTDHAWVAFDGPYEGTHPLFEVVTYNGMIGPLDDAPYRFAPMPLAFSTEGGTIQRERVLDTNAWVLATAWAEAEREGIAVADGGPGDYLLGAPDDYVFVDFDVRDGARVSFEAEVDGAWWSSLAEYGTSGLTDATVGGLGRTAIELPPGAAPEDVTALRVRSHGGAGSVSAEWFRYDAATLVRLDLGDAAGVPFEDGGTAELQ